jgi:hypothetical protein
MNITREDRWKSVIDLLKTGGDYGLEKKQLKTNTQFIYIGGRKLTPKEAYILSGIVPQFFKKYLNKEVPIEDIMTRLDEMWMRKKARQLKVEGLLK